MNGNPILAAICLALSIASIAVADEPLHTRIDALVSAQWSGPFAERSSDGEFLRRAYLDFAGRIPSTQETRQFLADRDDAKRVKLIDQLLSSAEYPRRMTELFHVMLMERLGEHDEWLGYLRQSFATNRPWDQMVKDMTHPPAEDESRRGAAFFLSKRLENYGQNPVDYPALVRDVGRLFLGIDVQCAQCHDHLFIDDYKQEDYQGLYAFLSQVSLRQDVKFPAIAEKPLTQKVTFQSVFVQVEKMIGPRLPQADEIPIPMFERGEEYATPPDKKTRFPGIPKFSPLQELSERLPRRDNRLFTRNIANRLWWVLMGRGLIHPLDLQHSANPPSHPELLDLLADEFAEHQFDMKWLLREIALSETYQRSSVLPESDAPLPAEKFAVFLEKPLSAEQLAVSLVQATGPATPLNGDDAVPKGLRDRFLKAFANPPREPEGEHAPSLKAALFLMNDAEVLSQLHAKADNLVARLERENDPARLASELYVAVLTREPSEAEINSVTQYLAEHAMDRTKAIGNLAWSLLASTEFLVNH